MTFQELSTPLSDEMMLEIIDGMEVIQRKLHNIFNSEDDSRSVVNNFKF